jgi:hypothetical protein
MDKHTSADDRLPIIELVVYVSSSFLMAWFLAGLSLSQFLELLELLAPLAFAGKWFIGAAAGAWFIHLIVRWVNRHREF